MQISAEKTKLMINCTNGISTDPLICHVKLEIGNSFKSGSNCNSCRIQGCNTCQSGINHSSAHKTEGHLEGQKHGPQLKIRLMQALIMSIFLYACLSHER
ncbi:hypothetical protein DPMN_150017 [Dreissena polymorpha]|uniref:Uncharacterized protein n=1 Tax=Dreissena polymorpha TaxID=45954 RepID=A0A9D4FCH1_DREPO|nr:hypothetical protein DPMN_150017 [Dreissena polymorpha]